MAQAHSDALEQIVRRPHIPVSRGSIIDDGKVTHQLLLTGGQITADRQAAQMRTFEVQVVDPDSEIDYEDLLFGKRILVERGAIDQVASVDTHAVFYGTTTSWIPSGTSTGVMNGVKVDIDGSLVLGP